MPTGTTATEPAPSLSTMEQLTADDIEQARDSLQAILAGIARGELAAAHQ